MEDKPYSRHCCSPPYWPRLMGAQDAAAYLGLSKTTFVVRVKQHLLPAPRKIGARVLWDIRRLDEFADALFESQLRHKAPPVHDADNWDDVFLKMPPKNKVTPKRRKTNSKAK